jgi:hypothetical protein
MTHALKTQKPYFQLQEDGVKMFELRLMDRPFKIGDTFLSQEWDQESKTYTGRESAYTITYILSDASKFGLKQDYCILQLQPKENI